MGSFFDEPSFFKLLHGVMLFTTKSLLNADIDLESGFGSTSRGQPIKSHTFPY